MLDYSTYNYNLLTKFAEENVQNRIKIYDPFDEFIRRKMDL